MSALHESTITVIKESSSSAWTDGQLRASNNSNKMCFMAVGLFCYSVCCRKIIHLKSCNALLFIQRRVQILQSSTSW